MLGSAIAIARGSATTPPPQVGVVDARDTPGPLDITGASLAQRDVRMVLRVNTTGAWRAADLLAAPGRSLCVTLSLGDPAIPRGRICVTRLDARPALAFTPIQPDGTMRPTRHLAAAVRRPQASVIEASFLPVAVGMSVGPYAWSVQTTWTDGATCATTCSDSLPDAGTVAGNLALLGVAPCFGAAARDAAHPCDNPALALTLKPSLKHASAVLDPYCDNTEHAGLVSVCGFGATPDHAASTFAVIGDSHAASLKTALEVLTLAKHWRGLSIERSACPATQAAKPILPTPVRSVQCGAWNHAVLTLLAQHPEVHTAFLSAHTTTQVVPVAGQSMAKTERAGYRAEILALLRYVRRVIVIRDTTTDAPDHLRCVGRALAAGQPPGPACARPRRLALERDPLAEVARDLRSPHVRVIDLTSHVCDARLCYPVVGGALVHRNETHMTPAFSASLGPFILHALDG